MDSLQEAFLRHFAEIAADGVFGDAHGDAYFLGDDLSPGLEGGEYLLFAMSCQHIFVFPNLPCTILLDSARNCTIDSQYGDFVHLRA